MRYPDRPGPGASPTKQWSLSWMPNAQTRKLYHGSEKGADLPKADGG
jgi:hypothetical protein